MTLTLCEVRKFTYPCYTSIECKALACFLIYNTGMKKASYYATVLFADDLLPGYVLKNILSVLDSTVFSKLALNPYF